MVGKRKKAWESEDEGAEDPDFDGEDGDEGKSTSGRSGAYSAMMMAATSSTQWQSVSHSASLKLHAEPRAPARAPAAHPHTRTHAHPS